LGERVPPDPPAFLVLGFVAVLVWVDGAEGRVLAILGFMVGVNGLMVLRPRPPRLTVRYENPTRQPAGRV
jgi:hypothetical protein